jgi:hypothetical protein
MKALSLEEIEATTLFGLTGPKALKRLLHTAREYHRMKEVVHQIAYWQRQSPVNDMMDIARQALKESEGGE